MKEQKIVELQLDDYVPYANSELTKKVDEFNKEGWIIKQIAAPNNTCVRLFVLLERDIDSNENDL